MRTAAAEKSAVIKLYERQKQHTRLSIHDALQNADCWIARNAVDNKVCDFLESM